MRGADGTVSRTPALPEPVREVFKELAGNIPGLLLEDKSCALALHYRLAPEARSVLTSAMENHARLFENENVQILHGKAVIEARRAGVDKGAAVATLAKQKPFAGRAILLGGQGFSVGRHFPGAEYVFDSPRAVREWLMQTAETGVR
jgi:trehalose 6-phosphate phosphatase